MKKVLSIVLMLCLFVPGVVVGEENQINGGGVSAVTANGVVKSLNTYDVVAPFTGVVKPFTWEYGDSVKADETLFVLDTAKVYAPADGTVQALFIKEGELCEDAMAQYGMIAAIEKNPPLVVKASTSGAYDDSANKLIHLGETIYFYESKDKDNEGEGRVISLEGENYVIELTKGNFDPGMEVKIHRDEKMGTKTCIGGGTVERSVDVSITASGRVIDCGVLQGQKVKKGQLLFELASSDADPDVRSANIAAPGTGVIGAIQVAAGQQVYKGQVLATVHDLSASVVIAEVDEVDLDRVQVGDSLSLVFDRYPDQKVSGTVTSISKIGAQRQNAAYFDVEITVTASFEILPSMNATVWLSEIQ